MRASKLLLAGLLAFFSLGGVAHACTDSWKAAVDGSWGDGSKWSTGKSPAVADDACITVAGSYTVTLAPYVPQEQNARVQGGDTVKSLTLGGGAGTQRLVVAGQSWVDPNNEMANNVGLAVTGSTSVASGGTVVLDSTGGGAAPRGAGEMQGGDAILSAGTMANAGQVVARSEDAKHQTFLGGTIANTGTIGVDSGTLGMPTPNFGGTGGQNNFDLTNNGTMRVAGSASLKMIQPGSGAAPSTFTSNGAFQDDGVTVVQGNGGLTWNQVGGAIAGNPVHLQTGTLLNDSAGAGGFLLDYGGVGVQGTIPAGQTVAMQTSSSVSRSNQTDNSQVLDLGGKTLVNRGTLVLDSAAGGPKVNDGDKTGAVAEVDNGTIENDATLTAQVESPDWNVHLAVGVDNRPGASFNVNGLLYDSGTTTNHGLVTVAPNVRYNVQTGGNFVNAADGTLVPQVASATSFGTFLIPTQCCAGTPTFTAGGTLAPQLVGGYVPPVGTEFKAFLLGGSLVGTFAGVTNGFAADYSKLKSTPPYIGLDFAGLTVANPGGSPSPGSTLPGRPGTAPVSKVGSVAVSQGKLRVALSCAAGGPACAKTTVTVAATEKVRGKKVISVRAAKKTKTRHVTIASGSAALAAGKSTTLTLSLDKAGRSLLKRYHRVTGTVTVSSGSTKLRTATVRFTAAKRKKKA